MGTVDAAARLLFVSKEDWGIVIGLASIALGLLACWPVLRRRRAALHWTAPTWKAGPMRVRTKRIPVLTIRWGLLGVGEAQGVECAVRSPKGEWSTCAWPKGTLRPPKENLYTYVNLLTGETFNTQISSPVDFGKPVVDFTDGLVAGEYVLRLRWFEAERPTKQHERTFAHVVG